MFRCPTISMAAAGGLIVLFMIAGTILYFWIGSSVKEHIAIAQEKYPGTAEEALIEFLMDESNPTVERTHTAIRAIEKRQLFSYARLNH
jgi:hypothetical protein